MKRTVVLNVVGLTRNLIGNHTPNLRTLLSSSVPIKAIVPAVTCSMQATYLTGKMPCDHGIVGNGWYYRDLGEVFFWRQSNRLVQGEKLWHIAKRRNPSFTCANTFWWFNMVTDVDYAVTPRPIYLTDGRKIPDCYTIPPQLRFKFNREFGQFPLFDFWGPTTSLKSSQWIAKAAMAIEEMYTPTLQLVYLPHLDYILQKVGPEGKIERDLTEIDGLCGLLLDFFRERNLRVIVLSEYGITQVKGAIHINRILRKAGFLTVKEDLGKEYLDCGLSRAFAVADHQVAHVYVRNKGDLAPVEELLRKTPGVEQVLAAEGKRSYGLDHERAGEFVLISTRDRWFSYYFWLDDEKAPDYARTVNIHAKPGYDPCELFLDPNLFLPKLKIAWTLLKKALGFRYLLEVIPLDADLVQGSHGRVTEADEEGPIFMTTEPKLLTRERLAAVDVFSLILDHVFCG